VAVGSVAVAAGKSHHHHHKPTKVKVSTRVNLTYHVGQGAGVYDPYHPYDPYDPYGQNASFTGKVKAQKGCARRRSVTVSRLGHTSSDKDGQFAFDVAGASSPSGNYRIHVQGKSFKRGHGKHKRIIKCKPASKTLTIVSAKSSQSQKDDSVPTKVKIAYKAPGNEYSPDTGFTGTVKAKQGCDSKRTVKLSHYGKTKSSKTGIFAFGVSSTGAAPGDYKVKVTGAKLSGGIKCEPVTATVTVD
jgi:hypothetical protein